MRKIFFPITVIGFLFGTFILLLALLAADNIQIRNLADFTWAVVEPKFSILRTAINFVVAVSALGLVILYKRLYQWSLKERMAVILMTISGVLISLVVYYGHSCCDTPVSFFAGFPLSWLKGMTPVYHYLRIPTNQYLIQSFSEIQWSINPWGLFVDSLFWFNLTLFVFCLRKSLNTPRFSFSVVDKAIKGT